MNDICLPLSSICKISLAYLTTLLRDGGRPTGTPPDPFKQSHSLRSFL